MTHGGKKPSGGRKPLYLHGGHRSEHAAKVLGASINRTDRRSLAAVANVRLCSTTVPGCSPCNVVSGRGEGFWPIHFQIVSAFTSEKEIRSRGGKGPIKTRKGDGRKEVQGQCVRSDRF